MSKRYKIVECFQIPNRGTAVVINNTTELPSGKCLSARIISPDGKYFNTEAFKEWVLRKNPEPLDKEAFLLMGVEKDTLVEGSVIEFHAI